MTTAELLQLITVAVSAGLITTIFNAWYQRRQNAAAGRAAEISADSQIDERYQKLIELQAANYERMLETFAEQNAEYEKDIDRLRQEMHRLSTIVSSQETVISQLRIRLEHAESVSDCNKYVTAIGYAYIHLEDGDEQRALRHLNRVISADNWLKRRVHTLRTSNEKRGDDDEKT